jgi:hypothetical protein
MSKDANNYDLPDTTHEVARANCGIPATINHRPKEKTYEVSICETLKRTVQVRANSADEAREKVEDAWKNGAHILDADDFKEVHFTACERQRDKGLAR